jgi:hypothetical protein
LASRIKGNEQGKERGKISLSEFLDIAAPRHRTRLPATIQAAGRISESDVSAHTRAERESTRLYNNVWWRIVRIKVELNSEVNPEKVDVITIAVDSTGIKVTNRGEWIRERETNGRREESLSKYMWRLI